MGGLRGVSGLERLNLSHNLLESASWLAGAADAPHSWLDLRANRLTSLAELETLLGRARGRIYLGTKHLQWWPKCTHEKMPPMLLFFVSGGNPWRCGDCREAVAGRALLAGANFYFYIFIYFFGCVMCLCVFVIYLYSFFIAHNALLADTPECEAGPVLQINPQEW